jgi:NitT/TauT family transport system substrate-binding protein
LWKLPSWLGSPRRTRGAIAAAALVVCVCVGAAVATSSAKGGRSALPSVKVVRDWPTFWSMQTYYSVGSHRNIWQQNGLDLSFVSPPQSPDIVKLVATGQAPFGIVNTVDLINAKINGLPLVGVASLWPRDMGGIMYFADSGMKTPADLKGKTVANYQWPQTELHLKTMLAHYGLSTSDVHIVPGGNYTVPLMVSGKVQAADAAVGGEDLDTQARTHRKVNVWVYTKNGVPPFYSSILATTPSYLKAHKDVVRRVIKALIQARSWGAAHPAQAVAYAKDDNKTIDVKSMVASWKAILPYLKPYKPNEPVGMIDKSVVQNYENFLFKGKLIKSEPPVSSFIDTSALPK